VGARVGQLFAGVNLARPRTLSESDWRRVREAESEVPPTLWIDCWSHTTTEVAARASRLRSTIGGLDLVVVDGIHDLAEEPLTRGEREEASLARAAQRLKNLALTMRCAVIATAQPALESARQGRRPRVSDIRGSGRIGQIADVVLFLWRPPDAEEAGGRIRCEWILDKVRLGDRSRFPMDFDRAAGGLWRTPLSPRLEAALQEVS
jgi:replicative DNA helicase